MRRRRGEQSDCRVADCGRGHCRAVGGAGTGAGSRGRKTSAGTVLGQLFGLPQKSARAGARAQRFKLPADALHGGQPIGGGACRLPAQRRGSAAGCGQQAARRAGCGRACAGARGAISGVPSGARRPFPRPDHPGARQPSARPSRQRAGRSGGARSRAGAGARAAAARTGAGGGRSGPGDDRRRAPGAGAAAAASAPAVRGSAADGRTGRPAARPKRCRAGAPPAGTPGAPAAPASARIEVRRCRRQQSGRRPARPQTAAARTPPRAPALRAPHPPLRGAW